MAAADTVAKYAKEGGTGSIHGHFYEIKTCALMYLLALNSNDQEFKLASNFKALPQDKVGHDFQDIGLQFYVNCNGQLVPQLYYYQLKYLETRRINLSLDFTSDYSLPLYYKWVKMLWTKSKNVFPDEDLATFIFFTNAGVNDTDLNVTWHEDELLSRLNTSDDVQFGKYFMIGDDCEPVLAVLPGDDINMKKKFLQQLRIYPQQPDVKQLDKYIKVQLAKAFKIKSSAECDCMYYSFIQIISKWWERMGKANFLTRSQLEDLQKSTRITFTSLFMNKMTDEIANELGKVTEYGFFFKEDEILTSKYDHHNVINLLTVVGTTDMTCLKLCQNKNLTKNECIIIKLKFFLQESDVLCLSWYQSKRPVLIILCDEVSENLEPENLLPLFIEEKGYNYFSDFNIDSDIDRKIIFVDLPLSVFNKLKKCWETLQYKSQPEITKNETVESSGFDLSNFGFNDCESFFDVPEPSETSSTHDCLSDDDDNKVIDYDFNDVPVISNFDELLEYSQDAILSKEIIIEYPNGNVNVIQLRNLSRKDLAHIKERLHINVLWLLMQNKDVKIIGSESVSDWVVSSNDGSNDLFPLIDQIEKVTLNVKKELSKEKDKFGEKIDQLSKMPNTKVQDVLDYTLERVQRHSSDNEFGSLLNTLFDRVFNTTLGNAFDNLLSEAYKADSEECSFFEIIRRASEAANKKK